MTRKPQRRRLWRSYGHRGETQKKRKQFVTRAGFDQKDNLLLGLINCDGLSTATWLEIKSSVELRHLDLVFILETKRREEEVREPLDIAGYVSIENLRSNENEDKGGGGIAVLCKQKDGLVFSVYNPDITDKQCMFVRKERQWVVITSEVRKTAVCGLYLGCQNSSDSHGLWNDLIYLQVQSEIIKLRQDGFRIILLGDFNAHIGAVLGQGIPGNHSEINSNGWRFLSFLKTADLIHVNGAVRSPNDWASKITEGIWTRQRAGRSTILDYGVISKEHADTVIKLEIDDKGSMPCGKSDHNWLVMSVKDNFIKQNRKLVVEEVKEVWDINEESDWAPFTKDVKSKISSVDKSSVDKYASSLSGVLINSLKTIFGTKKIKLPTKRVALPKGIVAELKKRKELKQNFLLAQREWTNSVAINSTNLTQPPSLVLLEEKLNEQNKKVENITSAFKQMRRKEAAFKCQGNSIKARRQFWKYVGGKNKKSTGFTALRDPESGAIKCGATDMLRITENFIKEIFSGDYHKVKENINQEEEIDVDIAVGASDHQYGSSSVVKDMWQKFGFEPGPRFSCSDMSGNSENDPVGFCNKTISVEEVQSQVKLLQNGKATGWDRIPNSAIKNAGSDFIIQLTELYNMMFESGKAPAGWNDGKLVLVHKKGSLEDIKMYRPLCVIISLSGLYSKILNERLTEVVEAHSLLGEIQNGFRKGRSCSDNQFILATILWKAREKNQDVHCAYVDLANAYPTVNREKLWLTMRKQGFGEKFINAIKALYTNDRTSTIVLGEKTKPIFLRRGLRQGCSMSPLLFALYVADLGEAINKSTHGFKVSEKIISGLFLADDLVLVAKKPEGLKSLLALTQTWCLFKDQKMSEKKSQIISPADESWEIFGRDGECIMSLKKVLQYKYLGLEVFQSMFKTGLTKQQDTIKKAHSYKNCCMKVSRSGPDTAELALCCWENVALPSIRWGVEVIPFSNTAVEELERTQSQMAKWILGLTQGAPNICAQEGLKLRFMKHQLFLVQLKFYQRVLLLPKDRWVHKALMEHFNGGWRSKYLEHIWHIRAETGLENIPLTVKELATHLDNFFLNCANIRIEKLNLPKMENWAKDFEISEHEGFQYCMKFKYSNAQIGNREPRLGYTRRRFCPLCPALSELNEMHLMTCPNLRKVRENLQISTFLNLCLLNNDSEQEAFLKFISGRSVTGTYLGMGEMIARGSQLSSLVEKFLSLW